MAKLIIKGINSLMGKENENGNGNARCNQGINSLMGKENLAKGATVILPVWYQFPNGEGKQQRLAAVILNRIKI